MGANAAGIWSRAKGDYQPRSVQRVWIPKLGSKELRPLGVPPVEERVVQKWRYATCSNRYSSTPLPSTATDSDPDAEPKTRYDASNNSWMG